MANYYVVGTEMDDGSEQEWERGGEPLEDRKRQAEIAFHTKQHGDRRAIRGFVRIHGGHEVYSYTGT